jgi:hypothetical protein
MTGGAARRFPLPGAGTGRAQGGAPVSHRVTRRAAPVLAVLLLATLPLWGGAGAATAAPRGMFVNFGLGGTPPNPNPAPGTFGPTCPQGTPGAQCTNNAAEPAIDVADDGTFYGSSENGLGAGTNAWKATSTDAAHYQELTQPNQTSATSDTGFAPGGGDTDIAAATAPNPSGQYNVYVSSLTLANVDVSTSTDGGATWSLNPIGATIPGDDRPWIAASGASKVCVSYHDVATFRIHVNCSTDAGTTFTQLGEAIDANHSFLTDQNQIGTWPSPGPASTASTRSWSVPPTRRSWPPAARRPALRPATARCGWASRPTAARPSPITWCTQARPTRASTTTSPTSPWTGRETCTRPSPTTTTSTPRSRPTAGRPGPPP